MRVAHNEGRKVESGYLIDEHGRPTTDPAWSLCRRANGLFGALLTFGEHKGYGLAVACELLGGALTGGGTWHRPADSARTVLNGMLTILIDPASWEPRRRLMPRRGPSSTGSAKVHQPREATACIWQANPSARPV
jgi:LDH2 family malate/lactate/ureidoglycolate dehydrogenase